jgi:hypothetical protein
MLRVLSGNRGDNEHATRPGTAGPRLSKAPLLFRRRGGRLRARRRASGATERRESPFGSHGLSADGRRTADRALARFAAHCDQLEHGVTVRLSDEVLYGRVLRRLELRSCLGGDGDIAFENGSCLVRRHLPRGASVTAGSPGPRRGRCAPTRPLRTGRPATSSRRSRPGPREWCVAVRSWNHAWSVDGWGQRPPVQANRNEAAELGFRRTCC